MFGLAIVGVQMGTGSAPSRVISQQRNGRSFVVATSNSEYAEVADMFRRLRSLDEGSVAFRRQREAIIERTLPLADHIARRFRNRGHTGRPAADPTGGREDTRLIPDVGVDDGGVVINVDFAVVVEVTIRPPRQTRGDATVDLDVVVDVQLADFDRA